MTARGIHEVSLTGIPAKLRAAAKWAGAWEVAVGDVRMSYVGMLMVTLPVMIMKDAVRALNLLAYEIDAPALARCWGVLEELEFDMGENAYTNWAAFLAAVRAARLRV